MFVERARLEPERVALREGAMSMTYRRLDELSTAVALDLMRRGVEPGAVIGVQMPRSLQAVVAILGILKCGAIYTPLDPTHPRARLDWQIEDSGARVILTQDAVASVVPAAAPAAPAVRDSPHGAAYLLYTSGTSGRPKGVIGTHAGVINRCRWMWRCYPWVGDDVAGHRSHLGFVDSLWEIFGGLLVGIPTVVLPESASVIDLLVAMAEQGVTRVTLVPTLLAVWLEAVESGAVGWPPLRLCISSGEALSVALCRRFFEVAPHTRLLNLYGSTEVAGDVTHFEVEPAHLDYMGITVPIGRPIDNMEVEVRDGRLFARGVGVALGYHRQAELTAARFLETPLGRCYDTGDRVRWRAVRWRPDGELEFLGRADRQLQLHGIRIEPAEIEARLGEHPHVLEAVVDEVEGALCAWFVARGEAPAVADLDGWLRTLLPSYMVPHHYVPLDSFPRTPSGKIDRTRLMSPPAAALSGSAASTDTERQVVAIFESVLEVRGLGADADFIALGGNSALALRALWRIEKMCGVQVPLWVFLERRTASALAARIDDQVSFDSTR
jgi:amino acid adenylation domain-containing protein